MSECHTRKFLFLSSIGYFQRLLKLKNLACLIGVENSVVSMSFQMLMRPGLLKFQYFNLL